MIRPWSEGFHQELREVLHDGQLDMFDQMGVAVPYRPGVRCKKCALPWDGPGCTHLTCEGASPWLLVGVQQTYRMPRLCPAKGRQMTEWRDVVGFEGFFWVSSGGQVKSRNQLLTAFVRKDSGRRAVSLSRFNKPCQRKVASLVAEAFLGPRPEGMTVSHLDDDKTNDRADNLAWESPKDNIARTYANGRGYRGESHHSAKLTVTQVAEIRAELATGKHDGYGKRRDLAKKYGIGARHLSDIGRGRCWRPIQPSCHQESK